jgi:hypothetical protein
MRALIRTLISIFLLLLLGAGIRLMYYGLETVVGAAPHSDWVNVLWLFVGILFFISGIIAGVLFLSPRAHS